VFAAIKKLFKKSGKIGINNLNISYPLSISLSLSEGIKKFPLLNLTSNKSFGLIPTIIPTSSSDTRSGGLNVDIVSTVFKYGIGTCKETLFPIENFIMLKEFQEELIGFE
tara:strand:- start:369 stop:698 length:330 start_codon:yes stop_codon:yes gene_type:complete